MQGADGKPREGAIGNMWQLVHNQGRTRQANHETLSTDVAHEVFLFPQPKKI